MKAWSARPHGIWLFYIAPDKNIKSTRKIAVSTYMWGRDENSGGSHGQASGQFSLYMLMKYCTLRQLRRLPGLGWVVYSGTVLSLRRFEFPCETETRLLGRGEYSSYGLETSRLSIPCRDATGFLGSDCGWCGVGPPTLLPTVRCSENSYLVDPASSICLSQRLSHACLSTSHIMVKPRMAH